MKPQLVIDLEKHYGVEFKDSNSGSYYATIKETRVRVSNHPSKFEEKFDKYYERVVDIWSYEVDFKRSINRIDGYNPFPTMTPGTIINHSILGPMVFMSYDQKNEAVEVSSGKKYFFEKFTY
jgi:hypothetical protein